MNEDKQREFLLREVMKNSTLLKARAYAILRDWSLADDAFQEALIFVNERWQDYTYGESVLPWASTILRYKSLEICRARKKNQSVGSEILIDLIEQSFDRYASRTGSDQLEKRKVALRNCLEKINEGNRKLLIGFYRDGLDCETLGRPTQKSANAVRIIISRVRKQLRECILSHA